MQLQTESMPATVSPTVPRTPALTTAQDINHHETTTTSTYGTTTAPQSAKSSSDEMPNNPVESNLLGPGVVNSESIAPIQIKTEVISPTKPAMKAEVISPTKLVIKTEATSPTKLMIKTEVISPTNPADIETFPSPSQPDQSFNSSITDVDENDAEAYQSYISGMRNMASEIRNETNQPDYQCLVCGKTYESWNKLRRHLRIHVEFRPFKCELCTKGFFDLTKLKRHKQTHTGVKPYQCHICNQKVSRPEHLRRHLLIHVDGKPYQCSACDFTGRRPERIRAHQRKEHWGQEDLTVVSLDVKLPDGIIINEQTGEVKGMSYGDHVKTLSELSAAKKRSADESLPTMVAPILPKLPPLTVPPSFSGPGNTGSTSTDFTGESSSYLPAIKTEAGSGPVFPGQISPRIQCVAPTSSPSVVFPGQISPRIQCVAPTSSPVATDEQPESKRIKLEPSQDNQGFQNPPILGTMIGSNVSATPSTNNGDLLERLSKIYSGSSSRRKAQPIKREPDETQHDCSIVSGSPAEEGPRALVPSFEGFGTTDFSSIGVPNSYAQNPSYGTPPINTGPPPVPRHMTGPPSVPRHKITSGNHLGHVTIGIPPGPRLAMEAKFDPGSPGFPTTTVGASNGYYKPAPVTSPRMYLSTHYHR